MKSLRVARAVAAVLMCAGMAGAPAWSSATAAAPHGDCEVHRGSEDSGEIPWAQERLDHSRVHQFATGAGQTVAVIDSGLNREHPQTSRIRITAPRNVIPGFDATNVRDCEEFGHGTPVAAIIAAPPLPGIGFTGLAPGAAIMPIKYYDGAHSDDATAQAVARAIRAAIDEGVDVINLSITVAADENRMLERAVQAAGEADIVVVTAAGNDETGDQVAQLPAAWADRPEFPHLLAVAAIDRQDGPAGLTAGSFVGIAAPGVDVRAPIPAAGPRAGDLAHRPWAEPRTGTSFATPFVSATAALVREAHPDLSAAQVVERLKATADRPGRSVPDPAYGYGIVNPYLAVTLERDDAAAPAKAAELPAVPPPNLPPSPDRTLQNIAYATASGLLGLAVIVGVGSVVWRRTAAERARIRNEAGQGPPGES